MQNGMNASDYARRCLKRVGVETVPDTALRLWLDMLDLHWDYYAALVESEPDGAEWRKNGWKFSPDDTGPQASHYRSCQHVNTVLKHLWGALATFRPFWDLPPESPEYVQALEPVSRVLWDEPCEPAPCGWGRYLCFTPLIGNQRPEWGQRYVTFMSFQKYGSHWLRPWDDSSEPTFYNLLFTDWLPREMLISGYQHKLTAMLETRERSKRATEWGYDYRQQELRWRFHIAVQQGLTEMRRQIIADVPFEDADRSQFDDALELTKGNYDERGQIVWRKDLPPHKQREWDEWVEANGIENRERR